MNEKISAQLEKNVILHREIGNLEKEIAILETLKRKPQ